MTPHTTACTGGLHEWHVVREYLGRESFPISRAEEVREVGEHLVVHAVPCRRARGKHIFKALARMNLFCSQERSGDEYAEIVSTYLKCNNCDKEVDVMLDKVEYS